MIDTSASASEIYFLRLPDVMKRAGMKKTAIYAAIKAGEFPAPVKRGRASFWPSNEIATWQQGLLDAR